MATHKSAIKRARQSERKRQRNRAAMSAMKTKIKKAQVSFETKDPEKIAETLREATSYIDKIADKKIIHRNKAGRIVSSLTSRAKKAAQ